MVLAGSLVRVGPFAHLREDVPVARGEAVELLRADFRRRDVDQLIRAGIPHEDGDFVVGRLDAILLDERGDGGFALLAPLAVTVDQVLRDARKLESVLPVFDFVTEGFHFLRQNVAIDLGKERRARIDAARLQRLPLLLLAVVGHVGRDAMRMQLRIEAAARIVAVTSDDEIAGDPVFVLVVGADAGGGLLFDLGESERDGAVVRVDEPLVAGQDRHHRDRLRRGKRQVVETAGVVLFFLGAVEKTETLPEFFAGFGMIALPDPLELFELNRALQPELFRADAEPLAGDALAFGVVIVPLKVLCGIALAVAHDSIREHDKMMLRQRIRISKECDGRPPEATRGRTRRVCRRSSS